MITRLDRSEMRLRKALRANFANEVKRASKGSDWRCAGGAIFRDISGWYVCVSGGPWAAEARTTVELSAKPMLLDPIFWQIVQAEENVKQPLSFRYHGAWTCPAPVWRFGDLAEPAGNGAAAQLANSMIDWASEQLNLIEPQLELQEFLRRAKEATERAPRTSQLATVICTLVLLNRKEDARELCHEALRNGNEAGFTVGRNTFPQLAIAWLDSGAGSQSRH